MEHYIRHGNFPINSVESNADMNGVVNEQTEVTSIHTEVKLESVFEVTRIFIVLAAFGMVINVIIKMWNLVLYGFPQE